MVKFSRKMIVQACILLEKKKLGSGCGCSDYNEMKICGKQYCCAG